MLFERLALNGGEPRLHYRFDITILEILVAQRAETKLFDDMPPVLVSNRRELKVRAPVRQQIQPEDPLRDAVIPIR